MRQYINRGQPFAGWLYLVAYNRTLELARAKKREPQFVSIHSDESGKGLEHIFQDNTEDLLNLTAWKQVAGKVYEIIKQLSQKCRLLLEMAADEYSPQEMVDTLKLPSDYNKKVSDDLRECRRQLRKRLSESGIDMAALFES
ncbi:MAG: hypothetical protein NT002_00910 [candidate division Zixibacteria bacterium]|nr:hypothetical protein [candidate division Zixibacteria bacterium]